MVKSLNAREEAGLKMWGNGHWSRHEDPSYWMPPFWRLGIPSVWPFELRKVNGVWRHGWFFTLWFAFRVWTRNKSDLKWCACWIFIVFHSFGGWMFVFLFQVLLKLCVICSLIWPKWGNRQQMKRQLKHESGLYFELYTIFLDIFVACINLKYLHM